jgi:uncharacterized protein
MRKEMPTQVFEVVSRKPVESASARVAASLASRMLGETWIPSRFNVVTDLPRKQQAVYNTFTGALAILDHEAGRQCVDPSFEYKVAAEPVQEGLLTLRKKGFLIPKGVDELEMVRLHYISSRYAGDSLDVTLLCTLACNLRCPYCFQGEMQSKHQSQTISKETEKHVVAHIGNSLRGKRELSLWWFGGEPLLTMGPMQRMSERLIQACKKKGIRYTAKLATNGTLLTRDAIEEMHRLKIGSVQVTMDVPRDAKRDGQGRETDEKVLDNLSLAAGKLKIRLRINLSNDSEEEFDHLYRGLIRRKLHKVPGMTLGIAHVFAPERGRIGCAICPVAHQSFVHVLAREHAKAASLSVPLERPLLSSRLGGCSATCKSAMVIGPDGMLYKCVEDVGLSDRAYGSVFLEGRVKESNLIPWLAYDWFKHAMCKDCRVLPQCAGGCPHRRMYQSASLKDEDFCYWDVRGELEQRIRDHVLAHTAGAL